MNAWFLQRLVLEHLTRPTFSMAWSRDGTVLALGGLHGEIFLVDLTGELLAKIDLESGSIGSLAWDPDGKILAAGSDDKAIHLLDVETRKPIKRLKGHDNTIVALAWSPDGRHLASGSLDWQIYLWSLDKFTHSLLQRLENNVNCLQWSPGGDLLASGSGDKTVRLWDVVKGKGLTVFSARDWVSSLAWSPKGDLIAAGTGAGTVNIWNAHKQEQIRLLEGHTDRVLSVSFSADGKALASKSADDSVKLWRCDTWDEIASFKEPGKCLYGTVFHPSEPLLVSRNDREHEISFWYINTDFFERQGQPSVSSHYANAKVVLVGDSGVGKTGLGLVLSGKKWIPTESSHRRNIWTLHREKAKKKTGVAKKESVVEREIVLWDLAGQPGYRIIHQLSLNDVSVALIVFDARSETDPFSGVAHWNTALNQARKAGFAEGLPFRKFLVAARIDRGGISASRERIDRVKEKYHFDSDFKTSAKEGIGIDELSEAIKNAIDWDALPIQSSNELFQEIKQFLLRKKKENYVILSKDELYRSFVSEIEGIENSVGIEPEFEVCIRLVEGAGLIRRLSFGNLVLMQPELLDAYAFRLVNAAKTQPDGLGSIPEHDARIGNFNIPAHERVASAEQESLLLIAMVEDLLRHDIGLREQGDLVFPSQFVRESPELPDPVGKEVVIRFEGPVMNIYATLIVRLAHSGMFTLSSEDMWRNASIFGSAAGGRYGLALTGDTDEGWAELSLFFQDNANEGLKIQFEEFVNAHLRNRALEGSIHRRWIVGCRECGTLMTDQIVRGARERGKHKIQCPVCSAMVSLDPGKRSLQSEFEAAVDEMEKKANEGRERAAALPRIEGKRATNDFDVFVCYNRNDQPLVIEIAERLKEKGILPWLDVWNVRPGFSWQTELEKQIKNVKSVAVFVGESGQGPWQEKEIMAFLRRSVNEERKDREFPVIPVILSNCSDPPELPILLEGNRWVDFRDIQSNPLNQLIWGITGQEDSPTVSLSLNQ